MACPSLDIPGVPHERGRNFNRLPHATSQIFPSFAGLTSEENPDPPDFHGDWVDCGNETPIDGLKLTFAGTELRTLLEARQLSHQAHAARWRHELTRAPGR